MQPSDADSQPLATVKGNPNIRNIGVTCRFTPETSRKMLERRRELKAERQRILAGIPIVQPVAPDPIASRVKRIDERIEALIDDLEECKTAREAHSLAMAIDRLSGVWSLLTGHPRPGVRKDKPRRSVQTFATPLE